MFAPSSVRNRFSNSTLRLNGRFWAPSTEFNLKISYLVPATSSSPLEPKLSTLLIVGLLSPQLLSCHAAIDPLVRRSLLPCGYSASFGEYPVQDFDGRAAQDHHAHRSGKQPSGGDLQGEERARKRYRQDQDQDRCHGTNQERTPPVEGPGQGTKNPQGHQQDGSGGGRLGGLQLCPGVKVRIRNGARVAVHSQDAGADDQARRHTG